MHDLQKQITDLVVDVMNGRSLENNRRLHVINKLEGSMRMVIKDDAGKSENSEIIIAVFTIEKD